MNKVVLMGRLTREPDVRQSMGVNATAVARYTIAVDRRFSRRDGNNSNQQAADFISCVAFGKSAEFAEKYLHQGTKLCVTGRIQTGSYTNRDGQKVYTTDVVVEEQEFAESKASADAGNNQGATTKENGSQQHSPMMDESGFMNIPDGIDEELPFS